MKPKTQLVLVALGGGAALLAIAGVAGKTTTQGVVFSKPDPASVAAVTSAAEASVASGNALIAARTHDTLTTISQLAALNTQLELGRLTYGVAIDRNKTDLETVQAQTGAAAYEAGLQTSRDDFAAQQLTMRTEYDSNQQTQRVGLQVSGSNFDSVEQTKRVTAQSAAAEAAAKLLGDAQLALAQLDANTRVQIAATDAATQTHIADQAAAVSHDTNAQNVNAVKAQASAQKTSSIFGAIGNVFKGLFGG